MSYGGRYFKTLLRLGRIIHSLPNHGNKPYQQCTKEEKARMALEVGFKEMSGMTYTEAWYIENEKYL